MQIITKYGYGAGQEDDVYATLCFVSDTKNFELTHDTIDYFMHTFPERIDPCNE